MTQVEACQLWLICKVCAVEASSVQTMPVQQVREGWRAVLDAARFHRTATVITYHEECVAVLVPPDWAGGPDTSSPNEDAGAMRELGVGEARARLRELVDAARDGQPTTIVRYGAPVARLVSYAAEEISKLPSA
jgi:prevent-host-death family protein